MNTIDLSAATFAERERLVSILEDLTPEQWASPSLCEGWRVREVVAHITTAYRMTTRQFLGGMLRHGFNFNRYADHAARSDTAQLSDAELLGILRDNVRHPWQPRGGGQAGALSHDVIHGLDITEPLGLSAAPADRIALVFADSEPRNWKYFGVDLTGVRLVATDTDVAVGDGEPVHLPAKDILLRLTGRRPL